MSRRRTEKKLNVDEESQSRDGTRRAIVALSILGMGAMTAVSLLQLGIVKHLPDPPIESFDSDKVNLSEEAFPLGIPDGVLSLAGFAVNIPLALWGGKNRASSLPLVPLVHAGKAVVEAAVAGWYFYQMPTKEKAWCGYCIVGAFASWSIAALTLPEAIRAATALSSSVALGRGHQASLRKSLVGGNLPR